MSRDEAEGPAASLPPLGEAVKPNWKPNAWVVPSLAVLLLEAGCWLGSCAAARKPSALRPLSSPSKPFPVEGSVNRSFGCPGTMNP
jgi:hypothetical protein